MGGIQIKGLVHKQRRIKWTLPQLGGVLGEGGDTAAHRDQQQIQQGGVPTQPTLHQDCPHHLQLLQGGKSQIDATAKIHY